MSKLNAFLISCLIILVMVPSVSGLSTIPVFKLTNKYIQTATFTLNTAPIYGNTTLATWTGQGYMITFLGTFSSYECSLSFQELNYQIGSDLLLNISLAPCNYYTTGIKACLFSTSLYQLKTMRARYMVLDSGFWKIGFYMLLYYIDGSPKLLNNTSPITGNYGLPAITFTTGTINNFLIINGVNVSSTTGIVDLQATATRTSATGLQLKISTTCTTSLNFMSMRFTLASWNIEETAAWPFPAARLNYKAYSAVNSGVATYTDDLNVVRSFNSHWGPTRIHTINQPDLTWTSDVSPSVSITGTSALPFQNLDWCAIAFEFKECDPTTPYYYIPGDICYNPCLPRMYTDNVNKLCGDCSASAYDCYTCDTSGTLCLTCNATLDFRVLNAATKRCVPIDGYYDDGTNNPLAKPCDLTACATCNTTSTQCWTCNSGFFLSGTSCSPCVALCSVCTTSTNCQTCMTGYTLSGSSCQIDCASITNCNTCSTALGCTVCSNFYALINATTCSPICGDGTVIGTQSCDDGNVLNGDGCSSLCVVQAAHYCQTVSGLSVCGNCVPNCLNCSTATDCPVCSASLVYQSTIPACVADCTPISLCLTCTLNGSTTTGITCNSCAIGYSIASNNSCVSVCGDGITISATETCDDHNTVSGDGCSSDCQTIEAGFYCNLNSSNGSICSTCMPNCISCTSTVACTTCHSLSIMASAPVACNADCTLIANCNSCHIASNTLYCDACASGYQPAVGLLSCAAVCGDGILLGSEGCDDGNLNNGDGCSNSCAVEPAFFCVSSGSVPDSVCSPCLQYCLACTSNSTCTACISPAAFSGTACVVSCPAVTTCNTCAFSAALAVVCSTCLPGYSLVGDQCLAVCGDGLLLPAEACDDANAVSGDGCSSSCSVETYFVCNGTSAGNYSVCSLTNLKLDEKSLTKDPLSNKVTVTFEPSPGKLPLFSNVDWANVLVPPAGSTVTGYSYDPDTGLLSVDLSYTNDLTADFQLGINPNAAPTFQYLGAEKANVPVSSSNNQALVAYPEEVYALSAAVKYLSLAAGILSLLMAIVALFGGRLVGLEAAAVIQMAFLSLLTVDNMSPTFATLSGLGLSCGFNKLRSYDLTESIDRPFKGVEIDVNFALNYNVMALFVLLPLLLSALSKILAKTVLKHRNNLLTLVGQYSLFEYTLYGYLFNAYIINSAFIVELAYFGKAADSGSQTAGLILGLLFIGVGAVYVVLFRREVKFFGEFKTKFLVDEFGQNFYLIIVGERLLTSILLISMVSLSFQNIFLALISAALLAVIAKRQPYVGKRKCLRPILNMSISIAVQLIFLANNLSDDPKGLFALYGPIIIVLLVFACIIYNIYYLVQDLKDALLKLQNFRQEYNQYTNEQIQNMEFQDLKAVILKGKDESIMKNVNETLGNMSAKELNDRWKDYGGSGAPEVTPKAIELTEVRNQLKQMKMSPENGKLNNSITYNQQDLNLIE